MQRLSSLLFSTAILLAVGSTSLFAQEATPSPSPGTEGGPLSGPPRNAVIVIRHAEDADRGVEDTEPQEDGKFPSPEWKSRAQLWPKYDHTYIFINDSGASADTGSGFTISQHKLSGNWKGKNGQDGTEMTYKENGQTKDKDVPFGEAQAIQLGERLGAFLQKYNFAPVKRAITMDPRNDDATPNPFCTIWPFLSRPENAEVELYLVQNKANADKSKGVMALIKNEKAKNPSIKEILKPEGGSTIICWTGEGLRDDDGVLAELSRRFRGKTYGQWFDNSLRRCGDVFIFYGPEGDGAVEKWSIEPKTRTEWKVASPEKLGEIKFVDGKPGSISYPKE